MPPSRPTRTRSCTSTTTTSTPPPTRRRKAWPTRSASGLSEGIPIDGIGSQSHLQAGQRGTEHALTLLTGSGVSEVAMTEPDGRSLRDVEEGRRQRMMMLLAKQNSRTSSVSRVPNPSRIGTRGLHEKWKARATRMSRLHDKVCGCLGRVPSTDVYRGGRKKIRQLGYRAPSTPIKTIQGDRLGIGSLSCSLKSAVRDLSHLVTLHVGLYVPCIVALGKATRLNQPYESSQTANRRLSCRLYGRPRTNSCRSSGKKISANRDRAEKSRLAVSVTYPAWCEGHFCCGIRL